VPQVLKNSAVSPSMHCRIAILSQHSRGTIQLSLNTMTSRDQARLQATFKQQNVLGHNSPTHYHQEEVTRLLDLAIIEPTLLSFFPKRIPKVPEHDKRERSFEETEGKSSGVSHGYGERASSLIYSCCTTNYSRHLS
jgi:hypothetical protein